MVFNDTTNYQGIIQDIDFLLFGDGSTFNTSYSLADRTRNVNVALDEVVSELYKADPNFMWDDTTNPDFPIATLDLTPGQDHYTILDSTQIIHRVRIKDREGKFKTLTPVLRRELSDGELEATGTPSKYYKLDNAVFPIPVPDYGYGNGFELEFQRGANHFKSRDTDKEPGFSSQFHHFLPTSAALRYAISNGLKEKAAQLRAEKEIILRKITEHYERRSPDERPKMRLRKPSIRRYGF